MIMSLSKFLFSTSSYLSSVNLLLFRVVISASLMTHGYGKLLRLIDGDIWSRTHFIFNEEISMALVVFGEFFAPLFVLIGVGTRIFAIPIIYTFCVIVFDVHWGDSFGKMEKGLMFLVSYVLIFLSGPGKISVDNLISKKLK